LKKDKEAAELKVKQEKEEAEKKAAEEKMKKETVSMNFICKIPI